VVYSFVCDILNKVAETMAAAAASVKNEGFAPGKMIMGVLSNRVSKSQVSPGDHIYSWRSAYTYAHHGSFFCLSCFPISHMNTSIYSYQKICFCPVKTIAEECFPFHLFVAQSGMMIMGMFWSSKCVRLGPKGILGS